MTADLTDALVPLAAQLVGTVRDYGPEEVARVLAQVPDGRHDALAIVLAAMVDPDARPKELLAWTEMGPVPSREFEAGRPMALCEECGELLTASSLNRHVSRRHKVAS